MRCDCHMHMILDGVYYRAAIDHQKDRPDDELILARLAAYRDAGITYLRDGGDAWGVCLRAKELAKDFDIEYRTPAFPIHRRGRYGGFIGRGFDTMAEYRELVGEAKRLGADFIKIMISGLMDFDHYGVITSQPLSAPEIAEMIAVAHGEGFAVMAHCNGSETVKAALAAGVDSVEHGAYFDEEAVRMLAGSHAVWVPTLVTIGNLIGDGRYPDDVLEPLLQLQLENVAACARMGGRIALGSDNGAYLVPHAQGTMDEYELLKQALGDETDRILERGNMEIRSRFRRN